MQRIVLSRNPKYITLDEAFEEFKIYCKAQNLSPQTINYYEQTFELFRDFSQLNSCGEITKDIPTEFTLYLFEKRKLRDVSVNSRLRNLAPFINFCIKRNYISPDVEFKQVKEEETIKEIYSQEEIKILLQKPNFKKCNFNEYRNWCIINFVLGTRLQSFYNTKH